MQGFDSNVNMKIPGGIYTDTAGNNRIDIEDEDDDYDEDYEDVKDLEDYRTHVS